MLDRTTPLPVSGFGHLTMPKPQIMAMPGGITLYLIDNPSIEVARMSIVWPAGTAECYPDANPQMLNSLLTEGAGELDGEEITDLLDTNGVWVRHEVHPHTSLFNIHALTERLPDVLPVVADIISRPRFDAEPFEATREQAAAEIEVDDLKVPVISLKEIRRLNYGADHPLSHACTAEEIRNADVDTVRRAWRRTMRQTRPYIMLAGHVSPLVPAVREWLPEIAAEDNLAQEIRPFSPSYGAVKSLHVADANQSSVRLTWPTINRNHPDYLYLRWAVMAFGGYFGSRLMTEIREEKGLTYGINAVTLGQREGASMSVHSQTAPQHVEALVHEVKNELRKLGSTTMSASELSRLKAHAGSELASMLDTPMAMADHYMASINNGLSLDYFDELQNSLRDLTPAKVCQVVTDHLLSVDPIVVVAGPSDEIQSNK